jgi:hypothetical protein
MQETCLFAGVDHPAASRSSAFICRTASRNPTNTARETMA